MEGRRITIAGEKSFGSKKAIENRVQSTDLYSLEIGDCKADITKTI